MTWMEHGLQKLRTSDGRWRLELLGALGIMGEMRLLTVEISKMIEVNLSLTSRLTLIDGSESFSSIDL